MVTLSDIIARPDGPGGGLSSSAAFELLLAVLDRKSVV